MRRSSPHPLPQDSVGAFDAKNRLAELLDRVEKGEAIVITRHGEPIARLVPFEATVDAERIGRAIAGLRKLRKGKKLGSVTLRQLIDEGRE